MATIKIILNSFIFWGGWIIIPVLMEIIPSLGSVFLLIRRHKRYKANKIEIKVYPEISLIVPVYNSADTLFACIASINNSTYPNDRIRIFLVNNKGQDNSFDVYAQCQRKFPELRMQWLNAEQGKSRALNLALYNSDGKYIINLDSDGVLEPSALVNMITKFEQNTDLNCMTGAILTMPEQIMEYKGFFARLLRNLEFMEYAQAFLAGRSYASEMNAVYTLSGAFSAFRKSVVLKSWMYNTDTICEDTHITFQMRYRQNERVEICESAIFFVDPIEDVNKLYTQRQRWQRGSLEVAQMFMDKSFKVKNMFKNISVKTLLYDHTFAFPRMIWYLALICLMFMGYSGKIILVSTGIIFALYTLIGYLYFITVVAFLKINRDVQKYYMKHFWCILFLPIFNFVVFFIRMAGIINSIQTDSAWRTRNLTEEGKAFSDVIKTDIEKPISVRNKIRNTVNIQSDDNKKIHEADVETEKQEVDSKKNVHVDKTGISAGWYICVGLLYMISAGIIYCGYWLKTNSGIDTYEILNKMTSSVKEATDLFMQVINGSILPIALAVSIIIVVSIIDYFIEKKWCGKVSIVIHRVIAYGSSAALVVAVFYINYQYAVLDYIRILMAR